MKNNFNKTFLGIDFFVFEYRSRKFQHLFKIEYWETSQNFNWYSSFRQLLLYFLYGLYDWVEIFWGFTKFYFKQLLKVFASVLKNKKVLSLKKFFCWRNIWMVPKIMSILRSPSQKWRVSTWAFSWKEKHNL